MDDVNQGAAGLRLGAPDRIDVAIFGWGAEVSVGRVMNGAGVSVCNQLQCSMGVSHVPEGRSVDLWCRDGHCARLLSLPDIPSWHIVVSSFSACSQRLAIDLCDHFHGSSKTFVRVSSIMTALLEKQIRPQHDTVHIRPSKSTATLATL